MFLNWFIKNPSCEEVAIDFSLVSGSFKYKIIIPSSEIWKDIPEFEGYEEALNQFPEYNQYLERIAFEKGVEWQAERSYNEDEVKTIINDIVEKHCTYFSQGIKDGVKLEWFKKFKK